MKTISGISGIVLAAIILFSCNKNESVRGPIVETTSVTGVLYATATCGGIVADDGGDPVVIRGVCWGVKSNPTTKDSLFVEGTGEGEFVCSIGGLTPGTKYNIRAFAINSKDTAYGNVLPFTTKVTGVNFNSALSYGTVTDIEGKIYRTIKIGTQIWMAENLKTIKFNDGTVIPMVTGYSDWENLVTPAYCWFNNDEAFYENIYGAYYNWFVVSSGKICPAGWHVPSDGEWQILVDYLSGSYIAGAKLKEVGTNNWLFSNKTATNESGFTALPAGMRGSLDGTFAGQGSFGGWWSSTEVYSSPLSSSWCRWVHGDTAVVNRTEIYKKDGFSVRCLQN